MDITYYSVTNSIKPHCTRCNTNYNSEHIPSRCKTLYGKGAERHECGGAIEKDLLLDWSEDLLKDYSIITTGTLDLYNECFEGITQKLEASKIGSQTSSGRAKVNIQVEIESFMRLSGVNMTNTYKRIIGPDGQPAVSMVTESRYKLPFGKTKVTHYAYLELVDRFGELNAAGEKNKGFLKFDMLADDGKKTSTEDHSLDELSYTALKTVAKAAGVSSDAINVKKPELIDNIRAARKNG